MKICSCFGSQKVNVTAELVKSIWQIYEKLINDEFDTFFFGGFSEFDEMCSVIAKELKEKYQHIKLVYVLTSYADKSAEVVRDDAFDEIISLKPDNKFEKYGVLARNCEMVNKSDFVLFYSTNNKSGVGHLMQYAKENNKNYLNFADIKN